jgi:hypothetical protein
MTPTRDGLSERLIAWAGINVAHPADHPGEMWVPCPACGRGPSGALNVRITQAGTMVCLHHCTEDAIGAGLSRQPTPRPADHVIGPPVLARHTNVESGHGRADTESETLEEALSLSVPLSLSSPLPVSEAATSIMVAEMLRAGRHAALAAREDVAIRLSAALGLDVPLGSTGPCVVTGHAGTARLVRRAETDVWKYRCGCDGQEYALADVHAARAHGSSVRRLCRRDDDGGTVGALALVTWYRRLLFDANLLEPIEVRLPGALLGMHPVRAALCEGFALLLGLRAVTHPIQPAAYSRSFARAWNAIAESESTVYTHLGALRRAGVLVPMSWHGRSRLFAPGAPDGSGLVGDAPSDPGTTARPAGLEDPAEPDLVPLASLDEQACYDRLSRIDRLEPA